MIPTRNSGKLAKVLGVELDEFNFVKSSIDSPVNTNIPGIFACGSCLGPMDIPHSVINASGAAAKVSEYIRVHKGENHG